MLTTIPNNIINGESLVRLKESDRFPLFGVRIKDAAAAAVFTRNNHQA
jgi:hypothetical protein